MFVPALFHVPEYDQEFYAFVGSAAVTLFAGGMLLASCRERIHSLSVRQTFLLTGLTWCIMGIIGAIPLFLSSQSLSFTDAVFESISGLSTTGSTVLSGLDDMPQGVLMWRSLLQWIGGIGIIGLSIAILPFLRIGGMQLFQSESSDRSQKVFSRSRTVVSHLIYVYLGLTGICFLLYMICGMSFFEGVNHAMTTLSTGGYSTSDGSMGHFSPLAQWVCIIFMAAGGIPFILYVRFLKGERGAFMNDDQFLVFITLVSLFTGILAFRLVWLEGAPLLEALRNTAFSVVSVVTTTGYAVVDYTTWGNFAIGGFFFLTFLGGCTGSTSGGFKIFRLIVLWRSLKLQFQRMIWPRGLFRSHFNGQVISQDTELSVISFSAAFVVTVVVITLLLAMTGLNFETSLSAAATAVANVGPGIGETIGPAGNFSSLSASAKWILCVAMLLGRLELFTLLVMLAPRFWRDW